MSGSGMGLAAVFSGRADRLERFRLDKFEPHSLRSLTLTEGVGFEPTCPFGRRFSRPVH